MSRVLPPEYHPVEPWDYLGLVKQSLEQLRYTKSQGWKKPFLDEDIQAYLELIESRSQDNARHFLQIRAHAREFGAPFDDGTHVIRRMHESGQWIWNN